MLWLSLLLTFVSASCARTPLYLAGFFPLSKTRWSGGKRSLPAVKLAIDWINQRQDILKDYELKMIWNDTQSDTSRAVKVLFDYLHTPPIKIMVIGPLISRVTIGVAEASRHWNLVQFAFSPRSSLLSDRERFPYFFRTIPSYQVINPIRMALLQHYNWTRIATLAEEYRGTDTYVVTNVEFSQMARSRNMTVLATEVFVVSDPKSLKLAIKNIKKSDARIILAGFYTQTAVRVFCEAIKQGLTGEKYVWILVGWTSHTWRWETPPDGCKEEEVKAAMDGTLFTNFQDVNSKGTVFGMDLATFSTEYEEATNDTINETFEPYAFDAVLSAALALNRSLSYLNSTRLEDFTYERKDMAELFERTIREMRFNGLTGPIGYDDTGNRLGLTIVRQSQGFDLVKVGTYHPFNRTLELNDPHPIRWKGGRIPMDRTRYLVTWVYVSYNSFIPLTLLAVIGICFAVSILFLNIRKRHLRFIRMSSPNMNNLILIGCVFTYTSVILSSLDGRFLTHDALEITCTIQLWFFLTGFTLAFGAMFAKTWRVHLVVTSRSVENKPVKDLHLILFVFCLLAIDVIILTARAVINPFTITRTTAEMQSDPADSNLLLLPTREKCTSGQEGYWIGAIYVYKGILLLFGLFLAWETRNIRIPALNDSKYIGMSVYNVVLLSLIGAPIGHILGDQYPEHTYVITSLMIIFCTTITLSLVFIPKLRELKVNPTGDVNVSVNTTRGNITTSMTDRSPSLTMTHQGQGRTDVEHYKEMADELEKTVSKLKTEVIFLKSRKQSDSRTTVTDFTNATCTST